MSREAVESLVRAEMRISGFALVGYRRLRNAAEDEDVYSLCDEIARETDTRWALDATAITVIFTPRYLRADAT